MEAKPFKMTPKQEVRQYKRIIDRATRALDRERVKLQNTEKKLLAEIKLPAKQNSHRPAHILIKDLTRSRDRIEKYNNMSCQLKDISTQLGKIEASTDISAVLRKVTSTIANLNEKMKIKEITEIMKEFQKQQMEIVHDPKVISDSIEIGGADYSGDEEIDEPYSEIYDGIGFKLLDESERSASEKIDGIE